MAAMGPTGLSFVGERHVERKEMDLGDKPQKDCAVCAARTKKLIGALLGMLVSLLVTHGGRCQFSPRETEQSSLCPRGEALIHRLDQH